MTGKQLKAYLEGRDFAVETRKVYERTIRKFLAFLKKHKGTLEKRCVAWKNSLRCASTSRALYVVAVRGFLEYCLDRNLIERNPMRGVRVRLSESGSPRQVLTSEEVKRLLETTAGEETEKGDRDRAILSLMAHSGLRVSSVVGLNVGDIQKNGDYHILRYKTKGHLDKDSLVVLTPFVLDDLQTYIRKWRNPFLRDKLCTSLFAWSRGSRNRLTTDGLRKLIARRYRQCGIVRKGVSPHSLRHTAATQADEAGASLTAIQDMLDHRSITTTERYVHRLRRAKDAAELLVDYGLKKT